MKGIFALGFLETIKQKAGKEKYQEILNLAGFKQEPVIFAISDVDDEIFFKILYSTSKILNIPLHQITEAFSDYWIHEYTQKIYKKVYQLYDSLKDFLLDLNWVHEMTTKNLPQPEPPKFEYQWEDNKTLLITYKSKRNLIDMVISHAKASAKFFNEKIDISKIGDNVIRIKFLDKKFI